MVWEKQSRLRSFLFSERLTLLFPRLGGLGAMGVFLAEPVSNFIGGAACYGTMLRTVWPELNKKERT